ncbi:MAG: hypothetical protein QOG48_2491 [Verrucomicrobiota bacterium]
MAEFAEKPHPPPAQIASFEKTLVDLFGYNQFEVIGESSKMLKTGQEDWMATSKYFALHVDARGETESGYELALKLYQEQQVLLETDTKLSKDSPLVIKGPQVGGGQLILVLVVKDEGAKGDEAHRTHRGNSSSSNPAVNAIRRVKRFVRNVLP